MRCLRHFALAALLAATGACRFGFQSNDRDPDAAKPGGGGSASDDATTGGDGPGLDGTTTSAACAAANVCDGFESATLDPLWTTSGTITIDTTVAHRGAQSIKAHTPLRNAGQAGYAILLESQTFTATPATLWVRGWFRLSALPAGNNGMELIFAGQNPQPQQGDYVFMHAGDLGLYDQFDGTIMNNATVPPLNTWFCVVFQVTLATTATGVMKMTSDSQPPVTLNNVVTQSSPPIDLLQIGIGYASGNVNVSQPATDMWMDDILVSGSTLTCAD